jgi:hypothetical protein
MPLTAGFVVGWHRRRQASATGSKPNPFARLRGASLNGVYALSPTEIWAAGDRVIARYSC